ncbi:MAG TPA: selenocysteine-specific translation elongation factor [Dehalococcoidia bacterium]|nr:selenocysteine-specific translation elongation factor [Dehalococcoidia bacterium]
MYVLGTAGHVDHGKSALVHAITGIDPDRLAEEKERGMTIDLGFAWLKLPSGREISIVDVPGHERFIKNMLAGVGGVDLSLLVIAADEGVMPQTREHLAILDLLNVSRGIVIITKKDLVDEEMLEMAADDAEGVIKGTVLEGAPIIATSALTRDGLPQLLSTMDKLLDSATPRRDIGKPRLSIDRAFSMKGFGTVVTGTLLDGGFSVGQEVEILPPGRRAHIRGLQTHKRKVDAALPGSRLAINLTGVATGDLQRGFVITSPGWLEPTRSMDVRLRALSDLAQPIGHDAAITFHTGAAEVSGKVRLLDRDKLARAESGWAQILLTHPVAVVNGDLFIIRSSRGTLGGGAIIDTQPRRHRRFQSSVIENLEVREKGSPEDILLATLENNQPAELTTILSTSSLSPDAASKALQRLASGNRVVMLGSERPRALLFTANGWARLREEAKRTVQSHHRQFPLRIGMPREELRSRLKIPQQHFNSALQRLIEEGVLIEERALVRLPSHTVELTVRQQAEADTFLMALSQNPFSPPSESLPEPELLNMLIEQRRVVQVSNNVVFAASAYDEMIRRITEHLKPKGKITVAEVRDMFQTSRKYALSLMEHLDEQRITRRVGDERVLR